MINLGFYEQGIKERKKDGKRELEELAT